MLIVCGEIRYRCVAASLFLATWTASMVLAQATSSRYEPRSWDPDPSANRQASYSQFVPTLDVEEIEAARLPETPKIVADVKIAGNQSVRSSQVRAQLRTRPGRTFDPQILQDDVRRLAETGHFANVRTHQKDTPQGVVITYELFERPTINYVKVLGNDSIKDSVLVRECGVKVGESLNFYVVDEARRKVELFYRERGYHQAQVTIAEGDEPGHRGIVLMVHEGEMVRIWSTKFVGNEIASDSRLKTVIRTKPGILYLFKGKLDQKVLAEDEERLTAYYRALGFFKATVKPELRVGSSGKWADVVFVINEGPRYRLRNVSFVGHERYTTEELAAKTEMKRGDFFSLGAMNRDRKSLSDLYGSEGYVYADIKADPRFLEEPGEIDLIYDIREGEQFRVGNITVHIQGDNPHTRRTVVLNRAGNLQPGEIVDIREVRDWERRLKSSQLFANEPQRGVTPRVAIRPPEVGDIPSMAKQPKPRATQPASHTTSDVHRGQSPEGYVSPFSTFNRSSGPIQPPSMNAAPVSLKPRWSSNDFNEFNGSTGPSFNSQRGQTW
jgi:outer membrane protein insertion porin family